MPVHRARSLVGGHVYGRGDRAVTDLALRARVLPGHAGRGDPVLLNPVLSITHDSGPIAFSSKAETVPARLN